MKHDFRNFATVFCKLSSQTYVRICFGEHGSYSECRILILSSVSVPFIYFKVNDTAVSSCHQEQSMKHRFVRFSSKLGQHSLRSVNLLSKCSG